MDYLTDPVLLSRLQFALTTAFHILFPPLTIGLGVFLVVVEGLWLRTRDVTYYRQFRFWSRIFAVNFAVGVVSGIPLEFQFGTNWGPFSATVGNFFGQVLGFEGTMERVLSHAKAQGYTAYTSTLVEPWRISVAGLTRAIREALAAGGQGPDVYPADVSPTGDPIAAFAILEADRHRPRGVSLALFWGLLKYYRRGYLELLDEQGPPDPEGRHGRDFVAACFERMLLGRILQLQVIGQDDLGPEIGKIDPDLAPVQAGDDLAPAEDLVAAIAQGLGLGFDRSDGGRGRSGRGGRRGLPGPGRG